LKDLFNIGRSKQYGFLDPMEKGKPRNDITNLWTLENPITEDDYKRTIDNMKRWYILGA